MREGVILFSCCSLDEGMVNKITIMVRWEVSWKEIEILMLLYRAHKSCNTVVTYCQATEPSLVMNTHCKLILTFSIILYHVCTVPGLIL